MQIIWQIRLAAVGVHTVWNRFLVEILGFMQLKFLTWMLILSPNSTLFPLTFPHKQFVANAVPLLDNERMRNNKITLTAIFAIALSVCGQITAQVHRCKNPTSGKVMYSDTACSSNTDAGSGLIQSKRSTAEIVDDRMRTQDARQEKLQQLEVEQRKQDLADQRRRAEQETQQLNRANAERDQDAARAGSFECTRAKRSLEVTSGSTTGSLEDRDRRISPLQREADLACLGPERAAQIEAARASKPQINVFVSPGSAQAPPETLTNCDTNGCWDNRGGRYRLVNGQLHSPRGTVCTKLGNRYSC